MKGTVKITESSDAVLKENQELKSTVSRLKDRIKWLERALFSSRSERIVSNDPNQGEFEGLLAELEELSQELEQNKEVQEPKSKIKKPRKKRRSLDELIPEDLPREDIVIDVPENERICPVTGVPFKKIDEVVTEKLAFKPGSYFVKRYIRPKYAHPTDSSYGILCEPMIKCAIPGSSFDESVTVAVGVDKCAYHLPLYRQLERMKNAGIDMSIQTLCQHYMRGAQALKPILELMKEKILAGQYLFTDDTSVKLQVKGKSKTVTGRMWIYISGGEQPAYIVFDFTVNRKAEHTVEFLKGFEGFVHADAYSGYDVLFRKDNITECACWMHVRRKFFEAEDGPVEVRETILKLIQNLYRYERVLSKAKPDDRLKYRKKKIAPIINEIFKQARNALTNDKNQILPRSKIRQAMTYLFNQEEALKTFLTDPHIKPDNGTSERAIRPLAIGRKNWMFAGSEKGGEATAIWLSIIQTCRSMDIDPFAYLDDILRKINSTDDLETLLPDRWKAQQEKSQK